MSKRTAVTEEAKERLREKKRAYKRRLRAKQRAEKLAAMPVGLGLAVMSDGTIISKTSARYRRLLRSLHGKPVEMSKGELRAMIAQAVRNTVQEQGHDPRR